jgi:hypothetical protein
MAAKMQKLDSKQVPQVIIMSVLAVGLLGYAGITLFGESPKPDAPSVKTASIKDASAQSNPANPGEAGATPEGATPLRGMQLPSIYNPNPFAPAKRYAASKESNSGQKPSGNSGSTGSGKAGDRNSKRSGGGVSIRQSDPGYLPPIFGGLAGGGFTGSGRNGVNPGDRIGGATGQAGTPLQPAAPARPDVVVTGIIDGGASNDMALVDLGQEHHILQVGDAVEKGYRVKSIAMDGVWLVNGPDTFFVSLGKKTEGSASRTGA